MMGFVHFGAGASLRKPAALPRRRWRDARAQSPACGQAPRSSSCKWFCGRRRCVLGTSGKGAVLLRRKRQATESCRAARGHCQRCIGVEFSANAALKPGKSAATSHCTSLISIPSWSRATSDRLSANDSAMRHLLLMPDLTTAKDATPSPLSYVNGVCREMWNSYHVSPRPITCRIEQTMVLTVNSEKRGKPNSVEAHVGWRIRQRLVWQNMSQRTNADFTKASSSRTIKL